MSKFTNVEFMERLFDFIVQYKKDNDGVSPTYREMMAGTGTNSTSYIKFYLEKLEDRGRLSMVEGGWRSIRVSGGKWEMNDGQI